VNRNTVRLSGVLAAVEPLRHTPAGLPVVDFTLSHESEQDEAGQKRQLAFEMAAKATGELATRIAAMRQGGRMAVQGFLNRKHRMSRQIVLHVTNMEQI
jgi:primosomal replication protein N